jgi:hypothetical protein
MQTIMRVIAIGFERAKEETLAWIITVVEGEVGDADEGGIVGLNVGERSVT